MHVVALRFGDRLPIVELTTVCVVMKMTTARRDPDKSFGASWGLFAIGAHSQGEAVSTFIHATRLEAGTDIA
jgi:hypothetical protein